MSFLELAGVDVPFAADGFAEERPLIGLEERSQAGKLFVDEAAEPGDGAGVTIALPRAYAEGLRRYINGEGETWNFDDGDDHGSRGSVPNAGSTYTTDDVDGPFGAGHLNIASGDYVEFPTVIPTNEPWTLAFRRNDQAGEYASNGWTPWVLRNSGTALASTLVYRGGSTTPVLLSSISYGWLTLNGSELRLHGKHANGTNAAREYASIVFRRFDVSVEVAAAISAAMDNAIALEAGLPYYDATGTWFPSSTRVRARCPNVRQATIGGDSSYRALQVTVREVGP